MRSRSTRRRVPCPTPSSLEKKRHFLDCVAFVLAGYLPAAASVATVAAATTAASLASPPGSRSSIASSSRLDPGSSYDIYSLFYLPLQHCRRVAPAPILLLRGGFRLDLYASVIGRRRRRRHPLSIAALPSTRYREPRFRSSFVWGSSSVRANCAFSVKGDPNRLGSRCSGGYR